VFGWLVFAAFVVLLAERLGIPPPVTTAVLGVMLLLMLLALLGIFGARVA
jgi:hypothetical protein